ncbi:unnamed protein product [Didymodactylos carnosus]|uniref:Uncharacterized protein n=1 Tax=Didymodactylos carnosus TaxID=1234261 RepID=A0A815CAP7_9BILA|nr:unnamed protein product [Didymodactylos carnosus]CAF4077329.1 unnamed protein product [Didymodactylos carnosus]
MYRRKKEMNDLQNDDGITTTAAADSTINATNGQQFVRFQQQKQQRHTKKRDSQLVVMLLAEIIAYLISTFLFPTNDLYQTVTSHVQKSVERQQIETFITYIARPYLIVLNACSTFFVWFAASKKFRNDFKQYLHYYRKR